MVIDELKLPEVDSVRVFVSVEQFSTPHTPNKRLNVPLGYAVQSSLSSCPKTLLYGCTAAATIGPHAVFVSASEVDCSVCGHLGNSLLYDDC